MYASFVQLQWFSVKGIGFSVKVLGLRALGTMSMEFQKEVYKDNYVELSKEFYKEQHPFEGASESQNYVCSPNY